MISGIWKFYLPINTPFIVSDMQSRLQANTNLHISKDLVLDLMKKDRNLSYTRCRSRPNNNLSRVNSSRYLFTVRFSQIFGSRTLIINVDESSINRNTKLNYAWSVRNDPKEYQNTPFKGSISLVFAIFSNRAWYSILINSTINSELLCHFIHKMSIWIADTPKPQSKLIDWM